MQDFPRWAPRTTSSKQEQALVRRLGRTRKLFAFLREHRSELFDDCFQAELESMYRATGAGKSAVPPALMAMATLMQCYVGASDAEAVELTVVDLRWQMVLGCLGATEPPFSQGALHDFRHRLIGADMDRTLLERTVALAHQTKAFDPKKLPKSLRVAMDSSPLEGAARVEDTINLLAHAARKVIACVAALVEWSEERVAREAGAPLLVASSIKRALDREWSDPAAKADAVPILVAQLDALEAWVHKKLRAQMTEPPLKHHLAVLQQIRDQDLEPDPSGGGSRIRKGVAPDRRVSIEDGDMRHGRKSKSKRFNGYKRHIAPDLDTGLILACAITPANQPEEQAAAMLQRDIGSYPKRSKIGELYIDRGYIGSSTVTDVLEDRGEVFCKPWRVHNGELFAKTDFAIDFRAHTLTCPAGQTQTFSLGSVVEFDAPQCARCPLRAQCTESSSGHGRLVRIADDEPLQHRLRATRTGRARLRQRTGVEHRLAHVARKQGRRARYRGVRKNLFDLRRTATVLNLETLHRNETREAA
jgi:IS5 family transposase